MLLFKHNNIYSSGQNNIHSRRPINNYEVQGTAKLKILSCTVKTVTVHETRNNGSVFRDQFRSVNPDARGNVDGGRVCMKF